MLISEIVNEKEILFQKDISRVYDKNFDNIQKITVYIEEYKRDHIDDRGANFRSTMMYLEERKNILLKIEDFLNKTNKAYKEFLGVTNTNRKGAFKE